MKNKVFLITLAFMLFLLFVVIATPVSAETSAKIGNTTINALTGGNVSVNSENNIATIAFSSEDVNNLDWHPAVEGEINRPANGWWLGFKLTFDDAAKAKDVKCSYTNYLGKQQGPESITYDSVDGKDYSCWIAVNQNVIDALKEDKNKIFATLNFTCDDPTMDFDVIVTISNPESVQLKEDTAKAVKVTVDGVSFTMEKNKTLNEGLTKREQEELQKLMTPESGYKLDGLYDGTTKVDLEKTKFSDNKELKVKFEKIPSSSESTTPNVDNIVVEEVNKTDDKQVGGTSSSAEKDVIIETLKEELKKNKELASKLEGKAAQINVEFSDASSNITDEVKIKMQEEAEKVIKDLKIEEFYDIEIVVLANGERVGNLAELTKPVELKVSMPKDLPTVAEGYARKYYVIREHDGEVTVLDSNVSEDGKYITFKTDKFSTYALAYKDEKIDNSTYNGPKLPQTGVRETILGIGIIAIIIGIVLYRKYKKYDI